MMKKNQDELLKEIIKQQLSIFRRLLVWTKPLKQSCLWT
jgi:hypothetical protein